MILKKNNEITMKINDSSDKLFKILEKNEYVIIINEKNEKLMVKRKNVFSCLSQESDKNE